VVSGWTHSGYEPLPHVCQNSEELRAIASLQHLLDPLAPIKNAWWAVFGQTLSWGLSSIYHFFVANPVLAWIGAYGLSIILLTLIVRIVLAPLFQLQLSMSKRNMAQQKKLAPQMAEIRKKYKGDPQKQQQATMALYKEHGVNPLSSLSGCLPALLQFPILSALYYVFYSNARANTYLDHFLFVPHLNSTPSSHPLLPGLPLVPALAYLIIPLLAAGTTFVQSRMMQQPVSPIPTEQEQQQQQMTRTMQFMMPLMIAYFAVVTPAGLGLYWVVSNCVSIVQQGLAFGWGGLRGHPAGGPPGVTPVAPVKPPPVRPVAPPKPVAPPPPRTLQPESVTPASDGAQAAKLPPAQPSRPAAGNGRTATPNRSGRRSRRARR
jgi:YidC/Oxa1 family membrane protein insertase